MGCPSAPTFVVVDLASQAGAVSRFVRGWSEEQVLTWLSQRGELVGFTDSLGNKLYSFSSRIGFQVSFFLEGDQFTFIGDNTMWRPRQGEVS